MCYHIKKAAMRNLLMPLLLFIFISNLQAQYGDYGILGKDAPEFRFSKWIDENGKKTEVQLADYQGKVVYILAFQSWCPGCHSFGFPSLQYLQEKYKERDDIIFLSIQTVFEGAHTNNHGKLRKTQKKYDLPIPFGHDDGKEADLNYSSFMKDYRSGGTPWVVIIDKSGKVVFNDFNLEVKDAIKTLKPLLEEI